MTTSRITLQDLIADLQRDVIAGRQRDTSKFIEYFYYDKDDYKVRWPTDRIKIRKELVDTPLMLDFEIMSEYDWLCSFEKNLFRHPRFREIAADQGYKGPKVISEGDSWHLYPIVLEEIIDQLLWPTGANPVAVWSTDCAADTLEHIWRHRKDPGEYLNKLIWGPRPPMYTLMLLSGGGNDLLNSGKLYTMLNNYTGGQTPKQLINMPVAQAEMAKIMCLFDYRALRKIAPSPDLCEFDV